MRISDWSSDVCASDLGEAACAAREKDRGSRDFFGLADAAKRRAARRYFQRVGIFPQRPREVGLDEAGRDAIHAHALRPEFIGEVTRQDRKSTRLTSSH